MTGGPRAELVAIAAAAIRKARFDVPPGQSLPQPLAEAAVDALLDSGKVVRRDTLSASMETTDALANWSEDLRRDNDLLHDVLVAAEAFTENDSQRNFVELCDAIEDYRRWQLDAEAES